MTEIQAEDNHSPVTGTGTDRRCAFRHEDGRQCKARPLADSEFCFFHDTREQTTKKRLEGRIKGGKQKVWDGLGYNTYHDIRDFETLRLFLNDAANALLSGRMDAKIGNCVASLAGVLLRTIETKRIEARLEEIESTLKDI